MAQENTCLPGKEERKASFVFTLLHLDFSIWTFHHMNVFMYRLCNVYVCAHVGVRTHVCVLSHSVGSDSLWPRGLLPTRSSVHGIFQAKILEWIAISSSRGPSRPRDWTPVFHLGRQMLYHRDTWEAHMRTDPSDKKLAVFPCESRVR